VSMLIELIFPGNLSRIEPSSGVSRRVQAARKPFHSLESSLEVRKGGGIRAPHVALAGGSEGASRYDGNPLFHQQPLCKLFRRQTKPADGGKGVKRAARLIAV